VGEAGPELIVHLNQVPQYQYGLENSDEGDTGPEDIDTSGPSFSSTHPYKGSGDNPLWRRILKSTFTPTPTGGGQSYRKSSPEDDSDIRSGGYALGKGLKGLLGMAGGGTVGAHHFYGSRSKLRHPAVEMVKTPQIRQLGLKGPDAVVPLVKKPGNKVNIGDIPNLVRKFGRYGK
jgi:hypothetical protein